MATNALPIEIPRPIATKVSRLRLLVRLYSLAEGLAALVVIAGTAFWAALAIDWAFEPRPEIRAVMWIAFAIAAAYTIWIYIARRALAALPGDSLALLVERRYPQLDEGLVVAVQAAGDRRERFDGAPWSGISGGEFNRALLEASGQRVAAKLDAVHLPSIFNPRPLLRKGALAVLFLVTIAAFAVMQKDAFGFWIERMQLSSQLWPRRVQLIVEGFEDRDPSHVVKVARDDDYELNVFASLTDGHTAPEVIDVRWRRVDDDGRGGGPMLRIGDATPGKGDAQQYRYVFKVATDLEFDVIGGDDRVRNLQLRAVERPAVTRVWLEIEYPKYMQRAPASVPVSGRAELPEGARAVCRLEANKPLRAVQVRESSEQSDLRAAVSSANPRQCSFQIESGSVDQAFLVSMLDVDGIENREPFRIPLSVILDEAPEVAAQPRGISTAVTPQATIPFVGKVSDDHGLEETWMEYQVDEGPLDKRPLKTQPEGLADFPINDSLDLAETDAATRRPRLAVRPGQKLGLVLKARDAYDLGQEPHVGSSQRLLLDVVTPSELRALLEKRELGLRQRFEAIYERMVGVEELLSRIDLNPDGAASAGEAASGARDVDPKAELERVRTRDQARIGGTQQTATQLAFETAGVAEGFDAIVAELINNRVDTEELKERLETGISEPLKVVSGEMLPRLETRIGVLALAYENTPATAAERLSEARNEAAATVAAMKTILDRMLELETYNELVELLRGIVADQQQIRERTQQQQREKLRGLLED